MDNIWEFTDHNLNFFLSPLAITELSRSSLLLRWIKSKMGKHTIQNVQNCPKSVEFDNVPLATDSVAEAPFCFDEKSFLLIGTFTARLHATFQRWKLSLPSGQLLLCLVVKNERIYHHFVELYSENILLVLLWFS